MSSARPSSSGTILINSLVYHPPGTASGPRQSFPRLCRRVGAHVRRRPSGLADGDELRPPRPGCGYTRFDAEGRHIGGDPPTKEMPLHSAFYDTRASAGAVVHLHSCHAVALSTMPDADEDDFLPRLTPYAIMKLGRVTLLPFFLPGDPAIGVAVRDSAGRAQRGDARQPRPRRRRQGRRGRLQRHRGAGGHRAGWRC